MKTVFARLSIFDEKFLPVENPPEFLRAAKKRLGKPYIERLENRTIYTFLAMFDKVVVITSNNFGKLILELNFA